MALELYEVESYVSKSIYAQNSQTTWGLICVRCFTQRGPSRSSTLDRLLQPALFVIEYALAVVMHWGVRPQAMIGHSIGEYVAACLAGVFSLSDALALREGD